MRPASAEILLVEDNDDDVVLARTALARTGCQHVLSVANDGDEALARLRGEAPPALILLDLHLPKVDGRQVLSHTRGDPALGRTPIVVMSSSRQREDVEASYRLGANGYYQKPLGFTSFVEQLTLLLTHWLDVNVPPGGRGPVCPVPVRLPSGFGRPRGLPRERTSVLVADGRPADRRATVEALESVGYTDVKCVASAEEGRRLLESLGGPPPFVGPWVPTLALVDLDLPGGDGRDLLRALRYRLNFHCLTVAFTRDADSVDELHRLIVNGVVRKPADAEAYRESVRFLAHYWLAVNEPPPHPVTVPPEQSHPG